MRTHCLEGRKREERVGELGNVACHKRGLTCWRGGRGKSRLVSSEMWHVTNEDSLAGGEVGGEEGCWARKDESKQKRKHTKWGGKGEGEDVRGGRVRGS